MEVFSVRSQEAQKRERSSYPAARRCKTWRFAEALRAAGLGPVYAPPHWGGWGHVWKPPNAPALRRCRAVRSGCAAPFPPNCAKLPGAARVPRGRWVLRCAVLRCPRWLASWSEQQDGLPFLSRLTLQAKEEAEFLAGSGPGIRVEVRTRWRGRVVLRGEARPVWRWSWHAVLEVFMPTSALFEDGQRRPVWKCLNHPCLASLRGSSYSVVPRSLLTLFPRDCARKKNAVSFGCRDLISGDS